MSAGTGDSANNGGANNGGAAAVGGGRPLHPAVVFRRRSGWEAADMGVLLWRANWITLLFFLGVPTLVFVIVRFLLPESAPEWLSVLISLTGWWLKPLLDRFCLQVVSVRFFEPQAPFRRLFKGLGRTLGTGLVGDLLWRRFSPCRSARMPLLVLERLKGKAYRRRRQLLSRNGLDFGVSLTFICLGFLLALEAGEILFAYSIMDMVQSGGSGSIMTFLEEEHRLVSLLFWIDLVLVESLYTAMGFALYINARVETEGWDIELLFKQCVEKAHSSLAGSFRAAVPALLVALFLTVNSAVHGAASIGHVSADTPVINAGQIPVENLQSAPLAEEAQARLEKVYESPSFGKEESYRKVQFKETGEKKNSRRPDYRFFDFPRLRKVLGMVLRLVLGAALIGALVFAAVYAYRRRGRLPPFFAGKSRRVEEAAAEPLQLLEEAAELHRQRQIREAWACCFRAFTAAFSRIWLLSFPPEATEYEILAAVRRSGGAAAGSSLFGGFETFVRRWINLAYGGRDPEPGAFEEALAACRSFLAAPPETVEAA